MHGNNPEHHLDPLEQKNNAPHLAESTVLYYIDEVFTGDLRISAQNGPDFSHYIGAETEVASTEKHGQVKALPLFEVNG